MKTLLTIFVLTIYLSLTAQTVATNKTVLDSIVIGLNADVAKKDIQAGHVKLMLSSGIASVTIVGQEKFEEKYKLKYYDNGCVGPTKKEMADYNKEVFMYLDKTYGKTWRKEVRKDVVGL